MTSVVAKRGERERLAALIRGTDGRALDDAEALALVRFLQRNKYPIIALNLPARSPHEWERAVHAATADYHSQREEYLIVRNAWAEAGIECMAIKSGGTFPSFPYTSDNLDLLVARGHRDKAIAILEELGYVWLRNIDETNKFLFRKFRAGRSISAVHLHTWVGWDVEFHEDCIWERSRVAEDDPAVIVPSPEDVILINAAHAFYENKRFTLFDVEKLRLNWHRRDLDWGYVEGVAERRGWLDGLFFALAVCAFVERAYFGEGTAPPDRVRHWEQQLERWPVVRSYYRRLLKRKEVALPFPVSFPFSKLLYYQKILRDRHDGLGRRVSNLVRTLFWGFKQKSGLNPQPSMLVSFSGLDGCGKTSHVRALSAALKTADISHRTVWSRPGCSPIYRALSRLAGTLAGRRALGLDASQGGAASGESDGFIRKTGRLLWALLNVADLLLLYTWTVRLPLLRGKVVLCDRYATDAVVELRDRLPRSDAVSRRLVGLLEVLSPRPKLAYLLDVPPGEAAGRSPDDVDGASLARQREMYLEAAESGRLRVRPAEGEFAAVNDPIVLEVLREYEERYDTFFNGFLLSNPSQLNRFSEPSRARKEGWR